MFHKILGLFARKKKIDPEPGSFYKEQAALAREVCDLLSVARKMDLPVSCTIEVGGVECGFIVRHKKDVFCIDLYNYCAAAALNFDTYRTDLSQNKADWEKAGYSPIEKRGQQIDPEGL